MIHRPMQSVRRQAGQSVCHTILAIACVMLALAIFFPIFEYCTLYYSPTQPDAFDKAGRASAAPPATTPSTEPKKEGPTAEPKEGEPKADSEAPKPAEGAGAGEAAGAKPGG